MPTYEVSTEVIVHTRVKVFVEADDPTSAIDTAAELFPMNGDLSAMKGWKASVELQAPKGVRIEAGRSYYIEQASGGERARRLKESA